MKRPGHPRSSNSLIGRRRSTTFFRWPAYEAYTGQLVFRLPPAAALEVGPMESEISTSGQLVLDGILPPDAGFHRLHMTFAGGAQDAYNRWYPYLEGYSPEFVRSILGIYAPGATRVFDPFGGTGTTAFVAGQIGLQSAICEVNPVMSYIFAAKVAARRLPVEDRLCVGSQVAQIGKSFASEVRATAPATDLVTAYDRAFGGSQFFSVETLGEVLQARTFLDHLEGVHPVTSILAHVAVLASLVPVSKLKRAGDLRFMTERELSKGLPTLSDELPVRLSQIASDLREPSTPLTVEPVILGADVRSVVDLPPQGFDALITSPPYINGTNYFRNARLELWFMRWVSTPDDLRHFRTLAITGGINDVTAEKRRAPVTSSVKEVVDRLKENAYDRRIPDMVSAYFAEMLDVFEVIAGHLEAGAPVAIDIGDSNYGGVHVPADRLLTDVLAELGYSLEDEVHLRDRRSKNGAPLKQVLLVYSAPMKKESAAHGPRWEGTWREFRRRPPHWEAPFAARNWGSALHSLCSYPGKLKPAIAHHLVKIFSSEGGAVFDPFAGVGTIPFEGADQGRRAFGIDLSPAAFTVAAAKVQITLAHSTASVLERIDAFTSDFEPSPGEIREVESFGLNRTIAEYYHPDTLREVMALRRFFHESHSDDPATLLVKAVCLHLLHGNRPYAFSRRSHPLTPYAPTGPTEYRAVLPRIRDKLARAQGAAVSRSFRPGRIYRADCTEPWPADVDDLEAVITSPPFFDSTRFHTQNWLRLWFAGWGPESFRTAPSTFVDERQKESFEVYDSILRQARDRLRRGGVAVLHLGLSRKCDMASEIHEIGRKYFPHSELFDESVAHCESHGLRDKGTVSSHQYLVLY